MARKVRFGAEATMLAQPGMSDWFSDLFKKLKELPGVEVSSQSNFIPVATPDYIKGFDIIFGGRTKYDKTSFIGNDQLLAYVRAGVGYDRMDVPSLTAAGIMLTNTPEAVRKPVASAIVTFILALSHRLFINDRLVREGRWIESSECLGDGLEGKTLGSIGIGNIGKEMFRLIQPWGMKHIAYDPWVKQEMVNDVGVKLVDIDTVLSQSDFINVSVPLNEQNRHLIGEKEFAKMKKTVWFINTARGPVVDEAALIRALQNGTIRGAGLDVFEQEPTPVDNPILKMDQDKVVLAPHALAHTTQFIELANVQLFRQINQIIQGEKPEALVNKEVWDNPIFKAKFQKFQNEIRS